MRKKVMVIICATIFLVAAAVSFFKFTYAGQSFIYKTFGGNNLHLNSGDKELYWFDVWHSNDPGDPMFKRIESDFIKFAPDLVLVEGGFNTFEGNRDEAVLQGESAFATYLAKQSGVEVENIEPSYPEQIAYLQTKHQPEMVLAMYLIRDICTKADMPVDMDFDLNAYLVKETQTLVEDGLDVGANTLDEILSIVNSYLPQKIDADTWRNAKGVSEVYNKESGVLYPVYNDIYLFRNIHVVELIREKQSSYSRIFIVMGGQHLIDTKAQLQEMYGVS